MEENNNDFYTSAGQMNSSNKTYTTVHLSDRYETCEINLKRHCDV